LIDELVKVAQDQGCYKVILDCAENNVDFYGKCGLTRKEVQMVRDTLLLAFHFALSYCSTSVVNKQACIQGELKLLC
jgi:hypothetical protein